MEQRAAHSQKTDTAEHLVYRLRIYLLGSFHIEWIDPTTGQPIPLPAERLSGQNAANALALLQALLSKPGRFATRSWLLEQFWPTSPLHSAEERLNDVASALRCLLRAEGDKSSLVHFVYSDDKRGAGYRLEGYPRIWCDTDAFEWFVRHALLLEQRGQDATACWERAYALSQRGMYLPEKIGQDWCRQHRDFLQGLQRDCIQHWTQQLRQTGRLDEAILHLRSYWLEYPTDEDALRPLLEILGERERFQEAEAYYAKACQALAEDKLIPDDRTNETIEVVRGLQIRRRKPEISSSQWMLPETLREQTTQGKEMALDFSSAPASSGPSETHHLPPFEETRRTLLKQFVGLTSFAASFAPLAETLDRYAGFRERRLNAQTCLVLQQLIETSWQLCNAGRMDLAEQTLNGFLPSLIERASFQVEAAALASQGLRLKSILYAHQLELHQMIPLCQQSVAYAQITGDSDVLSAAMNGLAVAFKYNHQYTQAFEAYEAALLASEQATPLLRSRVHAGAAAAFALRGQKQEALRLIGTAYEQFPAHPESDPFFFSADNGLFMLAYYEGLLYLALEQPDEAFQAFERAQHPDALPIPERNRLEILNHQGRAAILSGDLEHYVWCLEEGVKGALALQSQKRLDEALAIFQEQMPRSWLTEPAMKQVLDKLSLPAPKAE